MTENRDFLKEMEELLVETDGIRDALVSKTGHFKNLLSESGTLKDIMRELKEIRKEIKEGKEENEKKFKELTDYNLEMQQKMEENEKNLSDLKNEIRKSQKIPIRQAVLGEWKMIEYENFEGFKNVLLFSTFNEFSENLKFELVGGKLKKWSAGQGNMFEGKGTRYGTKLLYVEGDHLKSFWKADNTEDFYIENGQLHFVRKCLDVVCKRIYEKI